MIKKENVNKISQLANYVASKIKMQANLLLDEEKASLLTGILIGDKEAIEEEMQENFRDSNLTHMLAVSGAHVSYLLLGISFLMIKPKLFHKKFSKIIMILLLVFFILVTGKTPSVIRACLMAIYLIVGSLCYKRVSISASLSFSLFLMLVLNPYCIFDIGLQLSYGGTIGIIYVYPSIKKWIDEKRKKTAKELKIIKKIEEMILITISANIVIFPIMMFHFNSMSFTFWLSNLLASPIMGVIVILGFITIFLSILLFPIAQILSNILGIFLFLFSKIATICANLPFSKIIVKTPSIISILLYYMSLIFIKVKEKWNIKLKAKRKVKIIAILLIFITIMPVKNFILENKLKIFFVDVGQGDCTCVVTPMQKTILMDGGGNRDKESFDIGKQILLPYLLDRGITKIDYCLISHFDSDHVRAGY